MLADAGEVIVPPCADAEHQGLSAAAALLAAVIHRMIASFLGSAIGGAPASY